MKPKFNVGDIVYVPYSSFWDTEMKVSQIEIKEIEIVKLLGENTSVVVYNDTFQEDEVFATEKEAYLKIVAFCEDEIKRYEEKIAETKEKKQKFLKLTEGK